MAGAKVAKVTVLTGETPELELRFEPSPDDAGYRGPDYQRELLEVEQALREQGSAVQSLVSLQKSATGGSWLIGCLVPIATVAIPTLGHVLTAWIKARAGRKVYVKVGTLSVEAGTAAEVEKLLPQLKDIQTKSAEEANGAGSKKG